jgi:hypothetical protein
MAGPVRLIQLKQCEPNGTVIRNVWINPAQIIWIAMNGAVSSIYCRDNQTVHCVETPVYIEGLINTDPNVIAPLPAHDPNEAHPKD